ncbi:hypothetical protein AYI68_g4928, partial [Smittium mucronatum]
MKFIQLFITIGATAFLGSQGFFIENNSLVVNALKTFRNIIPKEIEKSNDIRKNYDKRQSTNSCIYPLGSKTISTGYNSGYDFYNEASNPLVIPCNGYYFSLEYQADQINSHYLWITDENNPWEDTSIQFELNINDGKPVVYFGESFDLGSFAFGQDENYKIKIIGDDQGMRLYIDNIYYRTINATTNGYQKYFQNGPKNLYIGGKTVGQIISNIVVSCNNNDSVCTTTSSSTVYSTDTISSTSIESMSQETTSEETTPEVSTTAETTSEESTPAESTSAETTTEETTSAETTPEVSTTAESTSSETTSEESTSAETTTEVSTTAETTSEESTPAESTSSETSPEVSTTSESTSEESTPAESTSAETTSEESSPEVSTTAEYTSSETTSEES